MMRRDHRAGQVFAAGFALCDCPPVVVGVYRMAHYLTSRYGLKIILRGERIAFGTTATRLAMVRHFRCVDADKPYALFGATEGISVYNIRAIASHFAGCGEITIRRNASWNAQRSI
jgi:hypothetical protein